MTDDHRPINAPRPSEPSLWDGLDHLVPAPNNPTPTAAAAPVAPAVPAAPVTPSAPPATAPSVALAASAPRGSAFRHVIIRTDGASRSNPGPASCGAVLIDASGRDARHPDAPPIASISEFLGVQTNNVAEYTGVLRALQLAHDLGADEVDLLLDSKLIVEQLAGRWRVKDAKLQPLHAEARRLIRGFQRWSAVHVPRAQNRQADALCNEALDRVAAGGPASVVRRPE